MVCMPPTSDTALCLRVMSRPNRLQGQNGSFLVARGGAAVGVANGSNPLKAYKTLVCHTWLA